MNNREIKSIIESILFVWSEPLHIDELMKIIELNKKETREILKEMKSEFDHHQRGIELVEMDDYFQLTTRKEHHDILSKLVSTSKRKISNSSMEVLAIIAYYQPITRVEIDNIRGVKSYSSIDTLVSRNLIEEVGRLDAIGKPILYGTTVEFLRSFDINSLDQLPKVTNQSAIDEFLKEEENED